MSLLEAYLTDLHTVRAAGGVAETSGYPALSKLLNGVGELLKPTVQCVIHQRSQGAGIPDGALLTADLPADEPLEGFPAHPNRGVIEVKPVADDAEAVAGSEQVARYLEAYGLVLVTNYREYLLVEPGPPSETLRAAGYSNPSERMIG